MYIANTNGNVTLQYKNFDNNKIYNHNYQLASYISLNLLKEMTRNRTAATLLKNSAILMITPAAD